MFQVKSFEQYVSARKRGADINRLILEMRIGKFSNDEIQEIIDTEHPSPDNYKVDMKGLRANLTTREIDYKELYEECKARLMLMQSSDENKPRRILKAKRTLEVEAPQSGFMGELQARLNKRQKIEGSTSTKVKSPRKSSRKSGRKSGRKSVGKSGRKSVGKSGRKSAGKSMGKSAGKSVGKSMGKSMGKSVRKSSRKSAGKSMGKSVRKSNLNPSGCLTNIY